MVPHIAIFNTGCYYVSNINSSLRAVSSVAEHLVYTEGVAGSNPAPPTFLPNQVMRTDKTERSDNNLTDWGLNPLGAHIIIFLIESTKNLTGGEPVG